MWHEQMSNSHLQGIKLPDALKATGYMDRLTSHAELILMVVPTPFVAATMAGIKDKLRPDQVRLCLSHVLGSVHLGLLHNWRCKSYIRRFMSSRFQVACWPVCHAL